MISTKVRGARLPRVEDYPALNPRSLGLRGRDRPRVVHLTVWDRGVSTRLAVSVDLTDQRLGGVRPWLLCPGCGARRARLLLDGLRIGCRACMRARYSSQLARRSPRRQLRSPAEGAST